jgi:hypothetical protein
MLGEELQHTGWLPSVLKEIVKAHRAVALREAVTIGPKHERDVGVGQRREAKLLTKPHLARRGQREVIGPHHLLNTLGGVIDDDGKVVGENPVISNEDQIVHSRFHGATHRVEEAHDSCIGPNPQCRTSTRFSQLLLCMLGELTTGTRVGTIGKRRPVGGRRRLANLAPSTKTGIGKAKLLQRVDSFDIVVGALRLKDDGPIPIEPECSEVVQLSISEVGTRHRLVEIFHAQHKPPSRCASRKPCGQRGAKVAEVQRAGGAWREPTVQPGTAAEA